MRPSVFKKTYYLGLSIILTPIIFLGLLFLTIFVTSDTDNKVEIKPKKEIVVETKTVIIRDTVFIKRQNTQTPKVNLEPKINDTVKKVDTL